MRAARLLLVALVACAVVAVAPLAGQPPAGKDAKADPDLERLQGDWDVTKFEVFGLDDLPPSVWKGLTISVRGSRITAQVTGPDGAKNRPTLGDLVLDSTRTPRLMDVYGVDEKGERLRVWKKSPAAGTLIDDGPEPPARAIYQLDAGKLLICGALTYTADRPTQFKAVAMPNPKGTGVGDRGYALVELSKKK